jgi:hypothetical protein
MGGLVQRKLSPDVPQFVAQDRLRGVLRRATEGSQHNAGQNAQDNHDDQDLNQCKCASPPASQPLWLKHFTTPMGLNLRAKAMRGFFSLA